MPIPKVLHRIWLQEYPGEDPMPRMVKHWGVRWSALHPDWHHIDWTDPERLPPLHNQDIYDKAKKLYPNDWKRFRSDLVRLELLWAYGGVYVDTDIEPHQNIDQLIEGRAVVVGKSPNTLKNGRQPITNAFIAAEPQHPFIMECIKALPHSVRKRGRRRVAKVAGPWLLTRVYNWGDWDIDVLPETLYTDGPFTHHWSTLGRRHGRSLD